MKRLSRCIEKNCPFSVANSYAQLPALALIMAASCFCMVGVPGSGWAEILTHTASFTVTASMDHLDFVAPVHVGNLLILRASVNRAFRTSMEIGVKAMVEDVREQRFRHVSSAYLTYVAVDQQGRGLIVPQLIPETEHQKRRFEDAGRRREMRAGETLRRKEMRARLAPGWYL